MKASDIRSISHLKAHAAEIVKNLATTRRSLVITQNGEAKAVLQDVASYEEQQEQMALLKILALGREQIERGAVVSARSAFRRAKKLLR